MWMQWYLIMSNSLQGLLKHLRKQKKGWNKNFLGGKLEKLTSGMWEPSFSEIRDWSWKRLWNTILRVLFFVLVDHKRAFDKNVKMLKKNYIRIPYKVKYHKAGKCQMIKAGL